MQYNHRNIVYSFNILAFMHSISLQCNLFEVHYLLIHLAINLGTQFLFVAGLFCLAPYIIQSHSFDYFPRWSWICSFLVLIKFHLLPLALLFCLTNSLTLALVHSQTSASSLLSHSSQLNSFLCMLENLNCLHFLAILVCLVSDC